MRKEQAKSPCALLAGLIAWVASGFFGTVYAQTDKPQSEELSLEKLLNTQISTASKYKQYVGDAPASVAIITAEDIDRFGYRTLDEVLWSVSGFYLSNDRNYVYIGTRGFGRPTDYNNRILLMLNGHTLNEGVFGSAMLGTDFGLDLGAVERIEIIKGPSSPLYGTSAVFAIINVVTKTGAHVNGFQMAGEGGSFGRKKGSVLFGKKQKRGLDISFSGQVTDTKGADLYFSEFDTPESNHGVAEGLDHDRSSNLFASVMSGEFSLQGFLVFRKKGVPTAPWEVNFNDDRTWTRDDRLFFESQYSHDFGPDKNLMIRAYYDQYSYEGRYPYGEMLTFDSAEDRWLGGEARFRWDLGPANRLIAGLEYQDHLRTSYFYADEESTYVDGDWPYRVTSIYLQNEVQIGKDLFAVGGVRWDDYSNVKSHTSLRVGLVYHPNSKSSLKLLYGEAFRAPSPYEINNNDPLSLFKPNFNLRPEDIRTLELTLDDKLGRNLYVFASVYGYNMRNLIDWVLDPADGFVQSQNVGKVDAWGTEVGLNAQLGKEAQGYLSFSIQKAKDMTSELSLTNSPAYMAKAGLTCPVLRHFFASVQCVYESRRLTVYETNTEPFLLANLAVSSRPILKHIRLSLQIRNLLDTQYSYPGGMEHVQPSIVQDGRNFTLGLAFSF